MGPLIPFAVIGLALLAYWKGGSLRKGLMTAERKVVFESALQMLKDPTKLAALADAFDKEGLKAEAELLRKRAKLRLLPAETKDARRAVFKKLMASTDPATIETGADAFEKEGATGAAQKLRDYAKGLRANKSAAPLAAAMGDVGSPAEKAAAVVNNDLGPIDADAKAAADLLISPPKPEVAAAQATAALGGSVSTVTGESAFGATTGQMHPGRGRKPNRGQGGQPKSRAPRPPQHHRNRGE